MWQSCKMIIVRHVSEQSVGSYEIMHAWEYVRCAYMYFSLVPRPLLDCFHVLCTCLEISLHAWCTW